MRNIPGVDPIENVKPEELATRTRVNFDDDDDMPFNIPGK